MMSRMRPAVLILFAIGLVVISATLVLRPSDRDRQSVTDRPARTKVARPKANQGEVTAVNSPKDDRSARMSQLASPAAEKADAGGGQVHQPPISLKTTSATDETPIPGKQVARSASQAKTKPSAEPSAQAIQLADDVRLPAALMPRNLANQPPEVAAAAVEIANTFYRDLANESLSRQVHQSGETTTMIQNSPTTERIRQNADEQFRALYGDEQYNRHTLYSAIEVMLPPAPASH